jgi:hypothetical protein
MEETHKSLSISRSNGDSPKADWREEHNAVVPEDQIARLQFFGKALELFRLQCTGLNDPTYKIQTITQRFPRIYSIT